MRTYQLANKYDQPALLEIVFHEVRDVFAQGLTTALAQSISLLQSMGEAKDISKPKELLMYELAKLNLGKLSEVIKKTLEK